MKKTLLILSAIAILAMLAGGCNKQEEVTQPSTATESAVTTMDSVETSTEQAVTSTEQAVTTEQSIY
jgi:PBP1b-binding outer membrane lipoprotein LpoB